MSLGRFLLVARNYDTLILHMGCFVVTIGAKSKYPKP